MDSQKEVVRCYRCRQKVDSETYSIPDPWNADKNVKQYFCSFECKLFWEFEDFEKHMGFD